MRRFLPILAILAAACGSATSGETLGAPPSTVIPTGNAGAHVSLGASGGSTSHGIGAPMAAVWAVLPRVYEELGIEVAMMDTRAHRLGNPQLRVSRRLGDTPVAFYVDCGLGPAAVPHANTARLTLSITTTLHAAGDSTEVRSALSGSGRVADAAGNDRLRCTTTGNLETRIANLLRERLADR